MKLSLAIFIVGGVTGSIGSAQTKPSDLPCTPIDRAGYVIHSPGRYCVTRDLHTRLDFADHSAERAVIEIWSSDVTVDLQGHRLGRGWLFVQPGGTGITIVPRSYEGGRVLQEGRMENITIENGRLTDFSKGIYFYREHQFLNLPVLPRVLNQVSPVAFEYGTANIFMRNLTFERCEQDFSFSDWAASREEFYRRKDKKPSNYRSN